MNARIALCCLALSGALAGSAQAGRKVTWYQMDFPPIYILEGPDRERQMHGGVDEAIRQALEARGYEVAFRVANQERIQHELLSGELACCSALVRNASLEDRLEYTIAHSLALSGGVVIESRDYHRFVPFLNREARLELGTLLADEKFKLGVAASRNYGGVIDQLLGAQLGNPRIFRRPGLDMGTGLLRMLFSDRIDYTLMYPWEAMYVARSLGRERDLVSLPVEGMPEYILGVGACPKSEEGVRVVALVNAAFLGFRNTPEYHALKEYWLDERSKALYRKYVQQYFQSHPPD
jgi:uncharacterized protein (TIGR02285 family)